MVDNLTCFQSIIQPHNLVLDVYIVKHDTSITRFKKCMTKSNTFYVMSLALLSFGIQSGDNNYLLLSVILINLFELVHVNGI